MCYEVWSTDVCVQGLSKRQACVYLSFVERLKGDLYWMFAIQTSRMQDSTEHHSVSDPTGKSSEHLALWYDLSCLTTQASSDLSHGGLMFLNDRSGPTFRIPIHWRMQYTRKKHVSNEEACGPPEYGAPYILALQIVADLKQTRVHRGFQRQS
jgi:hypothetical protein